MPPPSPNPRELISFTLIDPRLLAEYKSIDEATVFTAYGLWQGRIVDITGLTLIQEGQLINRNLADLVRTKAGLRELQARATEPGMVLYSYCSLCGRQLAADQCRRCGIVFPDQGGMLGARTIPIPAKVLAYVMQQGHRFAHEPPRT